jgi:hypothetical protein
MFNRGLDGLFDALPSLHDLQPAELRRLLTGAWLDAVDHRDLGGPPGRPGDLARLRRLASALAVRIVLIDDLPAEERRACAFVAAECLGVAREMTIAPPEPEPWALGLVERFELIEEALLYLLAGYDANAALTAVSVDGADVAPGYREEPISEWVLKRVRVLLDLQRAIPSDAPPAPASDSLRDRVRHELWRRIGATVADHVAWLKMRRADDPHARDALLNLVRQLELQVDGVAGPAAHPDLHHLSILLAAACDETSGRALRRLIPPDDDGGRFGAYQNGRANRMPLLWPAAAEYADRALPGPHSHAVVSVPTGAGKSAVAELAIAQAVRDGWVLYLAPTNALVAQVRRDLTRSMGALPGVQIRDFLGGAEYTELEGEAIGVIPDSHVLVMTPEKCSLALRQNPEAFDRLSLCVLDEAHLIGEAGTRGVVTELVIAEVLYRSPEARVLMLSALIKNAEDVRRWLEDVTDRGAIKVDTPWRPTRTLRAIAGLAAEPTAHLRSQARAFLQDRAGRRTEKVDAPIRLLAALHGAWSGEDAADYAIVDTGLTTKARVLRTGRLQQTDHTAPTTRVLVQALAERKHRVLAFLPSDRHAPFSYALALTGLPQRETSHSRADIDALLLLTDAELAGPARAGDELSEVHGALQKGVAVHTSAMLTYEQRASEIAFERGLAVIMFATGTLAQGLNLPATAVVVGGTAVGDRRLADTPEGRARTRAQLLNAIGRAGRAQVAARSISIVVPHSPLVIAAQPAVDAAKREAPFLESEDAAMEIGSRLAGLISGSLDGTLDMQTMAVPEQTAFAFLSYTGEAGDAEAVLGRSYAAHRAAAAEHADAVAETLRALGTGFLADAEAPDWVATAAHRAGLTLPVVVELQRIARSRLENEAPPETVDDWAQWLVEALASFRAETLGVAMKTDPWKSTAVEGIHTRTGAAWMALANTMGSWLDGDPLTVVGAALHARTEPISVRRRSGDPLPRLLRAIRDGFEFDLTALGGALVAIFATGAEEEDPDGVWGLPSPAQRALDLLPLAIRLGASRPETLALMRAGARPRVLARLLAARIPVPETDDDEDLRIWASTVVESLEDSDFLDRIAQSDPERELLQAAAYVAAQL